MKNYYGTDKEFRFEFPLDGDCLNRYDGTETENGLIVSVKVAAPSLNCEIYINEKKAEVKDGVYTADILINGYRNTLFAENKTTGEKTKIAVYRLTNAFGKYRLSSDDNILFLADINKNKDVYKSIFENAYLAMYKKAHDLYGAKVHLNIYYEFNEESDSHFKSKHEYFNLSMMTDKFKDEFIANSDWLKLSFHAKANDPDKPYKFASYTKVLEDIELIHKEIIRFAGKESLSNVCTVHWGEANIDVVRALRQAGYEGLTGYFEINRDGTPLVGYYYPADFVRHVGARDFWKDTDEDMMYGRIDNVLNTIKLEQVVPTLEGIYAEPHRAGFISVMIHEQYFHSDYTAYIPEFEDIVLTACKWLSEHGYEGALMSEVMFK